MQLKQVLEKMGFTPKEIMVYVSLLGKDNITATEVGVISGINRTSCYDILESLIAKGLVSKTLKNKRTYFNVSNPKALVGYLDREKEEAYSKIEKQKEMINLVMPEIMSFSRVGVTKPKVQYFEGEKGMREAYEDTLTAENIYYAYANIETMHEGLPNLFPDYYKRRVKAGIVARGIFPNNKETVERLRHNYEEKRESIIFGDQSLTFSPEVIIYNNKMLMISWKEKIAIMIESKELADLQKLIYEQLWKSLKSDPKNIISV
jgi:sugar-specific transcriptional regulator TrmB